MTATPPASGIVCPDCPGLLFSSHALFVAHRENVHPPSPQTISGVGAINSAEAFGTDPKE